MIGPTDRQCDVLRAIYDFVHEYGFPPTLRELGTRLNIHSTNGVNDHLSALERKGLIVRKPMASRGIAVTEQGLNSLGKTSSPYSHLVVRGSAELSLEGETLMLRVTPQALMLLDKLKESGLFGDSREEVCERLLYEKLRDVLKEVR